MYLKYDGEKIIINEVSSKASSNLRLELKKALECFARDKNYTINLDDEKITRILNDLYNDKKVYININDLDYDLKDIVIYYICQNPNMDFNPDMNEVSVFLNEEVLTIIDKMDATMLYNYLYGFLVLIYLPKLQLIMLVGENVDKLNERFSLSIDFVINFIIKKINEYRRDDSND